MTVDVNVSCPARPRTNQESSESRSGGRSGLVGRGHPLDRARQEAAAGLSGTALRKAEAVSATRRSVARELVRPCPRSHDHLHQRWDRVTLGGWRQSRESPERELGPALSDSVPRARVFQRPVHRRAFGRYPAVGLGSFTGDRPPGGHRQEPPRIVLAFLPAAHLVGTSARCHPRGGPGTTFDDHRGQRSMSRP
jgi:hypothetical protein